MGELDLEVLNVVVHSEAEISLCVDGVVVPLKVDALV